MANDHHQSPAEEHAERNATNGSPDGRACRLCQHFCPFRMSDSKSDGECRADLPRLRERPHPDGEGLHDVVPHDHWCGRYQPTDFAKKFQHLHHGTAMDAHQDCLRERELVRKVIEDKEPAKAVTLAGSGG